MLSWYDEHNVTLQAEMDISFEPISGVILDMAE